MPNVEFTNNAEEDLDAISAYTRDRWGAAQADVYLSDLEDCCQRLAEMPGMGRLCHDILADLWRMERGKHVIFYRQTESGILVVRILHQKMLPSSYRFSGRLRRLVLPCPALSCLVLPDGGPSRGAVT
jgi:toxin ParE1/3/4